MQGQPPASIATRTGLITGLFAGVLSLPVIALSAVLSVTGGPRLVLWLFFLMVALVAFAVAGFIATRRSGLLRSGTGAGSVAALVAAFIAVCLGLVIVILLASHIPAGALGAAPRPQRARALRLAPFRDSVLGLLLLVGAGPLGGFIGGLLGRLGRPARPVAARVTPPAGPQPYQPQPATPFTPPLYTGPVTPSSPTIPSVPPAPFGLPEPSAPAFPAE